MLSYLRPLLFFSVVLSATVQAENTKQIAISFDDSPRAARGYFSGPERAERLIAELKQHKVTQAGFFAVSSRLDKEGKRRLASFNDAGHIIANHTDTHPDFNKTRLEDYIANIEKADKAFNHYSNFRKWFRFPYLREGDTAEKRDGVRKYLNDKGYINAYITANNYDWYMENQFQKAIKDGVKINHNAMRDFYVDIIMEGIDYSQALAEKHLQRSPKQVLLLHETDTNALYIGDLVDRLRAEGWEIISLDSAYEDPIASYQTERVLKFNPGRMGEIARDKGQRKNLWHSSLEERYLDEQFKKRVLSVSTKP